MLKKTSSRDEGEKKQGQKTLLFLSFKHSQKTYQETPSHPSVMTPW